MTSEELDQRAGRVAQALSAIAAPGERVLIGLPAGLEFLVAFFGCLYAGVLPAAIAPASFRTSARAALAMLAVCHRPSRRRSR